MASSTLSPLSPSDPRLDLHSFPTRRSSDLPPRFEAPLPTPHRAVAVVAARPGWGRGPAPDHHEALDRGDHGEAEHDPRSEEHTSELQSPYDLVCRLLLEKKKKTITLHHAGS